MTNRIIGKYLKAFRETIQIIIQNSFIDLVLFNQGIYKRLVVIAKIGRNIKFIFINWIDQWIKTWSTTSTLFWIEFFSLQIYRYEYTKKRCLIRTLCQKTYMVHWPIITVLVDHHKLMLEMQWQNRITRTIRL